MRPDSGADLPRLFSPSRALPPILLGLACAVYAMFRELDRSGGGVAELFARMDWGLHAGLWLLAGCAMTILKDFGYIWQLRILTDARLSWRAGFEVVLLWNFFAAVTPSMVGGAAVALFMLHREGLSLGRSTAVVFTVVFFDQACYAGIPFLVSLSIPQKDIFAPLDRIPAGWLGTGVTGAFWTAWGGIAAYVAFLVAALFVAPTWINLLLKRLFRLPMPQRWRESGLNLADELTLSSRDLRDRSTVWWLKAWIATSLAWIGRYLTLNCVLAAFNAERLGLYDHLLAAGRQAVLWILMTLSPTPGGSGVAEMGFSWLFRDLAPEGLALSMAIVWRLLGYYPYLLLGIPVMTRWIKRTYGRDVREKRAAG